MTQPSETSSNYLALPPEVEDNGSPLPSDGTFGPNVLIFDPSMSSSDIQAKADAVFQTQESNQFGVTIAEDYVTLRCDGWNWIPEK